MKTRLIMFAAISVIAHLCVGRVRAQPVESIGIQTVPSLSIANDYLILTAGIVATQGVTQLVWNGGRTSVIGGESVFLETRTPGFRSLYVNTTLVANDLLFTWSFDGSFGTVPTFPLTMQLGVLALGDIDWRDSSGNIVERGVVSVQILSGNWQVSSLGGTSVGFTYVGTATISSLNDLTFSARLFNSATVPDTIPPRIIDAVATPDVLWPPNRRMIPISVMVDAVDDRDPSPVVHIVEVRSNEPQGAFNPDWEITGPLSLNLRAERFGTKEGRTYTIVVECEDSSGNVAHSSINVAVPHDRR